MKQFHNLEDPDVIMEEEENPQVIKNTIEKHTREKGIEKDTRDYSVSMDFKEKLKWNTKGLALKAKRGLNKLLNKKTEEKIIPTNVVTKEDITKLGRSDNLGRSMNILRNQKTGQIIVVPCSIQDLKGRYRGWDIVESEIKD